MIRELIQKAVDTFIHNPNQFASGGLLLMAVGSIMATLKSVPGRIWLWLVHQFTISLTITDDNAEFHWMRAWLQEQRFMKRVRHVDVATQWRDEDRTIINPAPGSHWMRYGYRIFWITVTRESNNNGDRRRESIDFKTIGRDKRVFLTMIERIRETHKKKKEKPELNVWNMKDWREISPYYPRPLDSVILPASQKEKLVADIENFKNNREWYTNMGIPYHRGYLFEGPPGTGKSSLVVGLSSYFNADVYMLKLSDMTDSTLRDAVCDITKNAFVLMEDIDCFSATQTRVRVKDDESETPDKSTIPSTSSLFGVTLSGLLNVLDGLLAPSGVIFFMTTNHVEKLDPAILRPGRVDFKLHIGMASVDQKLTLYKRFFNEGECPEKYLTKDMTMAELQQALMFDRYLMKEKQ